MLELGYHCLNLGFRGKYRGQGRAGDGALLALRTPSPARCATPRPRQPTFRPHWQGVAAPDEKPRFAVPLWTIALAAVR